MAQYSVRAASFMVAQLLQRYCSSCGLSDARLLRLIRHIESVAMATDLPAWESELAQLPISGLGDALPEDLATDNDLARLVMAASEVP